MMGDVESYPHRIDDDITQIFFKISKTICKEGGKGMGRIAISKRFRNDSRISNAVATEKDKLSSDRFKQRDR